MQPVFDPFLKSVGVALKWFGPEGGEPETYNGGRELDAFTTLYVPAAKYSQ